MRGTAWVLIVLLFAAAEADERRVANLQVSLHEREVRVAFDLTGAFTPHLLERIDAGLPSGFLYQFKLYRDHKRWFDNELDTATFEVLATYNAVTREYLVNYRQDGDLIDSRVVGDTAELERLMTHFEGLQLFTLGEVPPSWRLLVRARADLGPSTMLFFIPTRVTTPWAHSRKFRAPGGGS